MATVMLVLMIVSLLSMFALDWRQKLRVPIQEINNRSSLRRR